MVWTHDVDANRNKWLTIYCGCSAIASVALGCLVLVALGIPL